MGWPRGAEERGEKEYGGRRRVVPTAAVAGDATDAGAALLCSSYLLVPANIFAAAAAPLARSLNMGDLGSISLAAAPVPRPRRARLPAPAPSFRADNRRNASFLCGESAT